jgi:polysaccharide deacetylase 2 family uncharacterized protein YibQ
VEGAELAVVIDDVGYSIERGVRAIALPGPVTVAVLPFAPNTNTLARHALDSGKDVIIHQPMEPHPAPHVANENGTLTLGMAGREFDDLLTAALNAVPQSIGLSNHTGSLLTQHREPMRRLMQSLNHRGFFFLDSRTTADTVALDVALELGVPAVQRDVFLDHDPRPGAVAREFRRALAIARRNGRALIIAHPYRVSLDYLESELANLPYDIRLVAAKTLTRRGVVAQRQDPDALRISLGQ